MHHPTIVATLTAVLAALPAAQAAGLYTKSSPVLQVDGRSYDKLIAKSNYTSVRP
jgi:protein disulfide-isomerase A6